MSAFARGDEAPAGGVSRASFERALAKLRELGVVVGAAGEARLAAEGPRLSESHGVSLVVGRGTDARIERLLERSVERTGRALLIYSLCGTVVVAPHFANRAPCARCALLQDGHRAALAMPAQLRGAIDQAERAQLFAFRDRAVSLLHDVVERVRAAPAEQPEPGAVHVFIDGYGEPEPHLLLAHPSCGCATPPIAHPAHTDFSWSDGERRFTPLRVSDDDKLARVMYPRTSSAWPLSRESWGAATATAPNMKVRALGEAIERFCLHHGRADVSHASAAELGSDALEAAFIRELSYREQERATSGFRHERYDPHAAMAWSWAESMMRDTRRLVPTGLVGRDPDYPRTLVDASSNGYAAHVQRDRATAAALLELVERDAVLLSWELSCAAPRIETDIVMDGARSVAAFLATQDIDVPVVWLLAELDDGSIRSAAAADVCFDDALQRARAELSAGALRRLPPHGEGYDWADAHSKHGPVDHLRFYCDSRNTAPVAEHLRRRPELSQEQLRARWPRSDAQPLGRIVSALDGAGLEAWIVDRSLPELFGAGWHVVRALVPGIVELSWGRAYRRLAGRRATRLLREGKELTPWPHPIA